MGPEKAMTIPESRGYLVYDPSLCTGCHTCELICSAHHNNGIYQPSLSRIQVADNPFGGTIHNFEPKICYQCHDPKCMSGCTFDAIYIDADTGARRVNKDTCQQKCDGSKGCIEACSHYFNPPRIFYDDQRKVAFMCDLCNGDPQCVKWCSNGTLRYVSLAALKEAGGHEQNFEEAYTKDFGPPHTPYEGANQTFERVYPNLKK